MNYDYNFIIQNFISYLSIVYFTDEVFEIAKNINLRSRVDKQRDT